jgi:hypothetical protein
VSQCPGELPAPAGPEEGGAEPAPRSALLLVSGKLKAKREEGSPRGRSLSSVPHPLRSPKRLQPRAEVWPGQCSPRSMSWPGAREGGAPVPRWARLHYFQVADWGMERGGIMSRRYSRCRSTAEEVLCTAKLGLTKARVPPATQHRDRQQGRSTERPHHSVATCNPRPQSWGGFKK